MTQVLEKMRRLHVPLSIQYTHASDLIPRNPPHNTTIQPLYMHVLLESVAKRHLVTATYHISSDHAHPSLGNYNLHITTIHFPA